MRERGQGPLLAFVDRHPAMSRHLMRALAGYVQQVDESLAEIAFLDIGGRVARKLLDLSESHGSKTPEGIRIEVRLSQPTLASMVSASRENVNRALHRFTAHGDIRQDRGVITILRPADLRKRVSCVKNLARSPCVARGDPWALPQLVAAAGQVGGLGGVAGQVDGFVVGRA